MQLDSACPSYWQIPCVIATAVTATFCVRQAVLTCPTLPFSTRSIVLHVATAFVNYISALYSLTRDGPKISSGSQSLRREQKHGKHRRSQTATLITGSLGVCTAAQVFSLPYLDSQRDPYRQACARVVCFFYACKLLDLTLARGHKPPALLGQNVDRHYRLKYTWRLMSEHRYHSFDTAVTSRGRIGAPSKRWQYGVPLLILILTILAPRPETFVLSGLVAIQVGLEALHCLVHPSCSHPVFWQPLAAGSISEFWNTHWQQSARPFLISLGYKPVVSVVRRVAGQTAGSAAGVLATFSLSGVWHAWCVAALTHDSWRVGLGLWAVFMCQGLLCVLERAIGNRWMPRLVRVAILWAIALKIAGTWLSYAFRERRILIP